MSHDTGDKEDTVTGDTAPSHTRHMCREHTEVHYNTCWQMHNFTAEHLTQPPQLNFLIQAQLIINFKFVKSSKVAAYVYKG